MEQHSFTGFMTGVIAELEQEGRYATAHVYRYALRAAMEFVGGGEIFFGALTRRWLKRFQHHLEELQRSYNTISTYVRALRAVYNRAVDRGLIRGEYRLFAGLKTGVASEHKLALTARQMGRLVDRKLRLLNRNLMRLAGHCGLEGVKVSSYTARHTWATLAKFCQVPEEVISEGLGHSSLEVTRTYLKSFEDGELAKANRVVIDYIYSGKKNLWKRL